MAAMKVAQVPRYLSEQLVAVGQLECWLGDEEEATWAWAQAWNLKSIVDTAHKVCSRRNSLTYRQSYADHHSCFHQR